MVNDRATTADDAAAADRRGRARAPAPEPAMLGLANPNPFGDLHTIQHLTARLARALRPALAPLLRGDCRTWAEPLAVERVADYRQGRADVPAVWLALPAGHEAAAQLVLDHGFALELLDLFFGGTGTVPAALPRELSPAAAALAARLGGIVAPLAAAAWEPVTRIAFATGAAELNPAALPGVEGEDAAVVTRIGVAREGGKPAFLDLVYPVALLKPHTDSITRKVHRAAPQVAPAWRQELTRAVMNVPLPVRTVLAEPVLPLATLLELKVGDVIPIGLGEQVPVMVGKDRLGWGTVGTSAGRAAIQLNSLAMLEGPDR